MKSQLPIFTLVLFLLFIRTTMVVGQQVTFQKLSPPDGLNFEFVTGIGQDLNGIMWFSTKKGLYRYDGNQLSSFKNNPLNPNSLASNFLESIYVDSNGNIWLGSLGKGLDLFDPGSGNFTHFRPDANHPSSLSNDTVTAILRDKQGILWVGTHGGLDQFDPKTKQFIHYRNKKGDSTSLSNNQVRVLYEDKQGTLWVGTGSPYPDNGGRPEDGGLNRFDRKTGTFTRFLYHPNDNKSLISNKVSAIYEDRQGILWIGTGNNGLHKMNREQGTFERLVFDPAHPEKLSGPAINPKTTSYEHITFFTQDIAGSYWFGTVDAGLYYFNPKVGKIEHYQQPDNSSSGFIDNGAWKGFTSRDGIFWIGATQGNIYHVDPLHKKIPHTLLAGAPVNAFYEEPDGKFWIGNNQELLQISKATGNTKRYLTAESRPNSQNIIYRIKSDHQGNLWVGSSFGLHLWDKKKEKFIQYKYDPKDSNSLSNNYVIEIYEDRQKNLWIGTLKGLNLMDRTTGKFTRYLINPMDTMTFGSNVITSVLQDKTGNMWISSWNAVGIHLFDSKSNTFKTYLKGSSIMCLYEDTDGVLWAGGFDGLYRFNREVDNFIRYTDIGSPAGISNVVSIIEDNQKYLWVGSIGGIVRINPQRNETSTLGTWYGIGENTLVLGSIYKGLNGDLYFGDATGYFSFSPAEITQNLRAPEIVFTAFRLADQIVRPGEGGPVKKRLSEQTEIMLRYNQNTFSLDFAAIDYANPRENRLIYYLENYDNSWHPTSSEQRAYYFNVPPGKYIFRVKAVNSYGAWAEKKLNVIVLPPWWRTWWAYGLYVLLLIVALYGVNRLQRQRLLEAEKERQRKREIMHAKEIEKAYMKLKATQIQLIQSEKMASLGELTAGIAHEIQNPLNFVNNFSEVNKELLGELSEEIAKVSGNTGMEEIKALVEDIVSNEEKINHHGKRADAIVKGMLQHSRTSTGVKEPTDINALADEYLRLAYHGSRAKDKTFNATLNTRYDPNIKTINIIPQEMGRVLLNLITNAFYAITEKKQKSTDNYEPTISVSTQKTGDKVVVKVKDNGIGIQSQLLDKIFQPFFTTKPSGKGTGLGLSLSYDIIKAHGGDIKVETKEGEFTEFTIELPNQ
jgi:ligand-binding sensor domain-containing protein/signal transduction histidine kinase